MAYNIVLPRGAVRSGGIGPIGFFALFLSMGFAQPLAAQDPFEIRSVMDGVYTDAQAEEGEKTFQAVCSNCHNAANPLSGRNFLVRWTERPMYQIWEYMTTRMPYGAPGSLEAEEYAGVLAYILKLNSYPAGDTPMPHNGFEVANIDFDLRPDLKTNRSSSTGEGAGARKGLLERLGFSETRHAGAARLSR